jgi:H+/gluconate symporter-like permease
LQVFAILFALGFLVYVAYRGYSVILFAPVAALLAVLLTSPSHILPFYSGVFMARMVEFIRLYFPLFLLGAIFGKLIEISGFARSIVRSVAGLFGANKAILSTVLVCAILTYGGVSLFVVVFAVYPFAAELFRTAGIPKRLIPATIALGAFTFTMDALPGSPQVQNIIPTTFFNTDAWAAPRLGLAGSLFIFGAGMAYLEWRRRRLREAGEGYGEAHLNEPAPWIHEGLPSPALAVLPLVAVGVLNKLFGYWIVSAYGTRFDFAAAGVPAVDPIQVQRISAVWSVQCALLVAILMVLPFAWRRRRKPLTSGINDAIGGAMLAVMNTASEYGFGAVIAALPGFHAVSAAIGRAIQDPLLNVAITTNTMAAITGSSSGGLSIALGAMSQRYLDLARAYDISPEVVHRVATMASGGMDTLPHNGAIITLLAVTGLTHRQSYKDIFAMTGIKVAAAFVVIAIYYSLGIY